MLIIAPYSINYNFKTRQNFHSLPIFKGEIISDTFEKSNTKQELSEEEIIKLFNKGRPRTNKIKLKKEFIDEFNSKIVKQEIPNKKYECSVGEHINKYAIRRYLIENMPEQNPFTITLIADELTPKLKTQISKSFSPKYLEKNATYDNNLENLYAEKNYVRTLEMLHRHYSLDFTYEFLAPHIKRLFPNIGLNGMENIIKNYFEYHFHNEKNFTYDINLKKNKITATGYINGKPIARATDDNQNRAKAKLFLTVLKDLNLELKESQYPRKIKRKYIGNNTARNNCENVLKEIKFLNDEEHIDTYKDVEVIEYVTRALNLASNSKDPFRFQILEHYGDAILNIFAGKFLVEKNIDESDKTKYYSRLTDNKILAYNVVKLGLNKYLTNPEFREINYKVLADSFEAMICALYLTYPEERLYNYLKPIFEKNFQIIPIIYGEGANASNSAE